MKELKLETLFTCTGRNPFKDWKCQSRDGRACKVFDQEVRTFVFELSSCNIENTFIMSTKPMLSNSNLPCLNISMQYYQNQPFSFELFICDRCQNHRRIRYSTYNGKSVVRPYSNSCSIQLKLDPGWNLIQVKMCEITKTIFDHEYKSLENLKIYANCKLKRIYLSSRCEDEGKLPLEYHTFKGLRKDLTRHSRVATEEIEQAENEFFSTILQPKPTSTDDIKDIFVSGLQKLLNVPSNNSLIEKDEPFTSDNFSVNTSEFLNIIDFEDSNLGIETENYRHNSDNDVQYSETLNEDLDLNLETTSLRTEKDSETLTRNLSSITSLRAGIYRSNTEHHEADSGKLNEDLNFDLENTSLKTENYKPYSDLDEQSNGTLNEDIFNILNTSLNTENYTANSDLDEQGIGTFNEDLWDISTTSLNRENYKPNSDLAEQDSRTLYDNVWDIESTKLNTENYISNSDLDEQDRRILNGYPNLDIESTSLNTENYATNTNVDEQDSGTLNEYLNFEKESIGLNTENHITKTELDLQLGSGTLNGDLYDTETTSLNTENYIPHTEVDETFNQDINWDIETSLKTEILTPNTELDEKLGSGTLNGDLYDTETTSLRTENSTAHTELDKLDSEAFSEEGREIIRLLFQVIDDLIKLLKTYSTV